MEAGIHRLPFVLRAAASAEGNDGEYGFPEKIQISLNLGAAKTDPDLIGFAKRCDLDWGMGSETVRGRLAALGSIVIGLARIVRSIIRSERPRPQPHRSSDHALEGAAIRRLESFATRN